MKIYFHVSKLAVHNKRVRQLPYINLVLCCRLVVNDDSIFYFIFINEV